MKPRRSTPLRNFGSDPVSSTGVQIEVDLEDWGVASTGGDSPVPFHPAPADDLPGSLPLARINPPLPMLRIFVLVLLFALFMGRAVRAQAQFDYQELAGHLTHSEPTTLRFACVDHVGCRRAELHVGYHLANPLDAGFHGRGGYQVKGSRTGDGWEVVGQRTWPVRVRLAHGEALGPVRRFANRGQYLAALQDGVVPLESADPGRLVGRLQGPDGVRIPGAIVLVQPRSASGLNSEATRVVVTDGEGCFDVTLPEQGTLYDLFLARSGREPVLIEAAVAGLSENALAGAASFAPRGFTVEADLAWLRVRVVDARGKALELGAAAVGGALVGCDARLENGWLRWQERDRFGERVWFSESTLAGRVAPAGISDLLDAGYARRLGGGEWVFQVPVGHAVRYEFVHADGRWVRGELSAVAGGVTSDTVVLEDKPCGVGKLEVVDYGAAPGPWGASTSPVQGGETLELWLVDARGLVRTASESHLWVLGGCALGAQIPPPAVSFLGLVPGEYAVMGRSRVESSSGRVDSRTQFGPQLVDVARRPGELRMSKVGAVVVERFPVTFEGVFDPVVLTQLVAARRAAWAGSALAEGPDAGLLGGGRDPELLWNALEVRVVPLVRSSSKLLVRAAGQPTVHFRRGELPVTVHLAKGDYHFELRLAGALIGVGRVAARDFGWNGAVLHVAAP